MNSERESKEPIAFCNHEINDFEIDKIRLDSNFKESPTYMTPQSKNYQCLPFLSSTSSTIDKSSTSKSLKGCPEEFLPFDSNFEDNFYASNCFTDLDTIVETYEPGSGDVKY